MSENYNAIRLQKTQKTIKMYTQFEVLIVFVCKSTTRTKCGCPNV